VPDGPARRRLSRPHARDQPRLGVHARVVREKAVLVRQQDQQVRVDEGRDQRREPVVVAELDLLDGDRVVLVDDRDHAEAQQRQQRAARVQVALAVAKVVGGQEDLRDRDLRPGERRLPRAHQPALPHRGRGLLELGAGPRRQRQALAPRQDRARGDDDDLPALGASRGHVRRQAAQRRGVETAASGRQDSGAQFDDDALRHS
jgi:hypothetical protein